MSEGRENVWCGPECLGEVKGTGRDLEQFVLVLSLPSCTDFKFERSLLLLREIPTLLALSQPGGMIVKSPSVGEMGFWAGKVGGSNWQGSPLLNTYWWESY